MQVCYQLPNERLKTNAVFSEKDTISEGWIGTQGLRKSVRWGWPFEETQNVDKPYYVD